MDDDGDTVFTDAKDIALTATDEESEKIVDVVSLVLHNLGQQVLTEASHAAQQHAGRAQAQAQAKHR